VGIASHRMPVYQQNSPFSLPASSLDLHQASTCFHLASEPRTVFHVALDNRRYYVFSWPPTP
jgi:hypothetical protein